MKKYEIEINKMLFSDLKRVSEDYSELKNRFDKVIRYVLETNMYTLKFDNHEPVEAIEFDKTELLKIIGFRQVDIDSYYNKVKEVKK